VGVEVGTAVRAGVGVVVGVGVAVAVGVGVTVTVAVAVGVGFFCVAFPFRVTVAEELFPLVALLVMPMVPSSVPLPVGVNSTSTSWLIEPGRASVPPAGEISVGNVIV